MIEPYVSEKQCVDCGKCKWATAFAPGRNQCRNCRNGQQNARLRRKSGATQSKPMAWTDAEDRIVTRYYPQHGANAVITHLPERNVEQVRARAVRIGLKYLGPRLGGNKAKEEPYGLPAHDYADEDRAWQATRIPPPPRAEFLSLGARL